MKSIKIKLTEDEARLVLFCLEKQKRKHLSVAEKISKENRPTEFKERLKDLHLQLSNKMQNLREKFLFEMFNKRIKF